MEFTCSVSLDEASTRIQERLGVDVGRNTADRGRAGGTQRRITVGHPINTRRGRWPTSIAEAQEICCLAI